MGCFPSKDRRDRRRSSNSEPSTEHIEAPIQLNDGRVGIIPISSNSSSSQEEGHLSKDGACLLKQDIPIGNSSGKKSSSRERCLSKHAVTNPYKLVEKLAVGACGYDRIQVQEISDDESSIELNATCLFGSPNGTQASSCNQSMDDVEDEEVHDWLAEMSSTSTTLFTSTNSCGDERQQALKPTYSLKSKPSSFGYRTLSEHHHITAAGPDLNDILASPKQTGKQSCNDKHIVKDTIHVERRHAPLPSKSPPATTGNWLTNRYCVNDYIVLSQIGKGAHAEVRLCKHKKSNELFAVKIMNRKLLQSKSTVDIQKEVRSVL